MNSISFTEGHLTDLYAVRGAPDDPNEDPLPRGVWPVLCSAYLPARPAPALPPMPLPKLLAHSSHENQQWRAFAANRAKCSHRHVLMSIFADDAETAPPACRPSTCYRASSPDGPPIRRAGLPCSPSTALTQVDGTVLVLSRFSSGLFRAICGTKADSVDHIIAHKGDMILFWDKTN
jgi:hypothetical protein